jgi:hypothetical protein
MKTLGKLTSELAVIIAETKNDIRLSRNLSRPIGKKELLAYLKGLRQRKYK